MADHLQRDGIDIFLQRHIADDAVRPGAPRDFFDTLARARDKRHLRASPHQFADQREPEARRATGDRDANAVELFRRIRFKTTCHR